MNENFQDYLKKSEEKISNFSSIFNLDELELIHENKDYDYSCERDVIYFSNNKNNSNIDNSKEKELLFLFGFDFYIKELEDQQFKRIISQSPLNFRIFKAYAELKRSKKNEDRIKISDILNLIQNEEKDSLRLHKIISEIFSMAYYLEWKLEKDLNDLDGDYFIEIPNNFMLKLKQRFNFDIQKLVYEDEEVFIFLNAKNKLNAVLKNYDFLRKDIVEKIVIKSIQNIFNIKNPMF